MSKENADYLMASAQAAGIVDHDELSIFMGQMQLESTNFTRMTEALNYSGRRLLQVFPGRNGLNTLAEANEIAAGGPEAVANAIYGGRWGARNLGNTEEGDGWNFHGRGYVQLTGRANYEQIGAEIGMDLASHPELVESREIAARVAIHYWQTRVVAKGVQLDVAAATREINGGQNHIAERTAYAAEWKQKLDNGYRPDVFIEAQVYDPLRTLQQTLDHIAQGTVPHAALTDGMPDYLRVHSAVQRSAPPASNLRQGVRSEQVRALQSALDGLGIRDGDGRVLTVDGIFGSSTRQAVENFQLWNGLETSGVVDRLTRELLHDSQTRTATMRPGDAHDAAAAPARTLPDPTNPSHPDHAMYERIRSGVRAIDEANGKPYDEASERISRSLLARCKGASACADADAPLAPGMALRRVDHVLMGTTGNVFAIEGRLDDPAHRRASVSAAEAALVTVQESDRKLAAVNTLGEREHDVVRQQATPLRPGHPSAGLPCMAG